MPIRESERARYPKDWPAISRRIRAREGNRCKWCAAPNGETVVRVRGTGFWAPADVMAMNAGDPDMAKEWACVEMLWRDERGRRDVYFSAAETGTPYFVRIVLTVAHLDHTPENCADDNLVALCQRCHNRYDAASRRAGRRARRLAASGQGELLGGAA